MNRRDFLAGIAALPLTADALAASAPALFAAEGEGQRPFDASMWIFLWDLQDEGFAPAINRLKEHGMNAMSLAAAYHAGKFLLPHNPKRKVYFPEDGAVYFEQYPRLYGRVRPIQSQLTRNKAGLLKARTIADEMGVETRAWTVCCHNSALGMRYPDIAARNVFGDILYHTLCPSNGDVRIYLNALVKDICANGVKVIELEALRFQGYTHGYHHEREGITLTGGAQFLLGLCFCDACVKGSLAAGVDTEKVRQYTKSTLEAYLADPDAGAAKVGGFETLPQDLLAPMFRWRQSVVESLLEELTASAAGLSTTLRPMVSLDPLAPQLTGLDPVAAQKIAGSVLAMGYVKDGATLAGMLDTYLKRVPKEKVTVGLQVGLPESGGKAEFMDRCAAARRAGVAGFNFYNYGLIPLDRLSWVKEALAS